MVNLWSSFAWTRINDRHIIKYQPKGSICATCKFLKSDCSGFDFSSMPVHSKNESGYVVVCTEFVRNVK